ncbi:hypothetical protein CXG81DRAFT_27354 [Caulochytrium protostelioides]|uniref:N-terminal Ras-GEF domain-containing protein n=1 Tax=Caulochytrium protostelioides TaxID=1555241 RepID=A0A4V1IUB0_9FUNG|nr:hypothetical protein CXG81DRAFT_27354 [Caulochytrium protostelioides]|eukprot:RKO99928.1 hypothetical protein CXG81DRAFT_27354 [Caulochytrium protostelioides]
MRLPPAGVFTRSPGRPGAAPAAAAADPTTPHSFWPHPKSVHGAPATTLEATAAASSPMAAFPRGGSVSASRASSMRRRASAPPPSRPPRSPHRPDPDARMASRMPLIDAPPSPGRVWQPPTSWDRTIDDTDELRLLDARVGSGVGNGEGLDNTDGYGAAADALAKRRSRASSVSSASSATTVLTRVSSARDGRNDDAATAAGADGHEAAVGKTDLPFVWDAPDANSRRIAPAVVPFAVETRLENIVAPAAEPAMYETCVRPPLSPPRPTDATALPPPPRWVADDDHDTELMARRPAMPSLMPQSSSSSSGLDEPNLAAVDAKIAAAFDGAVDAADDAAAAGDDADGHGNQTDALPSPVDGTTDPVRRSFYHFPRHAGPRAITASPELAATAAQMAVLSRMFGWDMPAATASSLTTVAGTPASALTPQLRSPSSPQGGGPPMGRHPQLVTAFMQAMTPLEQLLVAFPDLRETLRWPPAPASQGRYVSAATLEGAVLALFERDSQTFVEMFFLGFRQFTSPLRVARLVMRHLRRVLDHVDRADMARLDAAALATYERLALGIHLIGYWLHNYWPIDFAHDPSLVGHLDAFLTLYLPQHPVFQSAPDDAVVHHEHRQCLDRLTALRSRDAMEAATAAAAAAAANTPDAEAATADAVAISAATPASVSNDRHQPLALPPTPMLADPHTPEHPDLPPLSSTSSPTRAFPSPASLPVDATARGIDVVATAPSAAAASPSPSAPVGTHPPRHRRLLPHLRINTAGARKTRPVSLAPADPALGTAAAPRHRVHHEEARGATPSPLAAPSPALLSPTSTPDTAGAAMDAGEMLPEPGAPRAVWHRRLGSRLPQRLSFFGGRAPAAAGATTPSPSSSGGAMAALPEGSPGATAGASDDDGDADHADGEAAHANIEARPTRACGPREATSPTGAGPGPFAGNAFMPLVERQFQQTSSLRAHHSLRHRPAPPSWLLAARTEIVAQQLCLLDRALFQAIDWIELLRMAARWRRDGALEGPCSSSSNGDGGNGGLLASPAGADGMPSTTPLATTTACADHADFAGTDRWLMQLAGVHAWVLDAVARAEGNDECVRLVEKLVRVAQRCYRYRNASTLFAIVTALLRTPRLRASAASPAPSTAILTSAGGGAAANRRQGTIGLATSPGAVWHGLADRTRSALWAMAYLVAPQRGFERLRREMMHWIVAPPAARTASPSRSTRDLPVSRSSTRSRPPTALATPDAAAPTMPDAAAPTTPASGAVPFVGTFWLPLMAMGAASFGCAKRPGQTNSIDFQRVATLTQQFKLWMTLQDVQYDYAFPRDAAILRQCRFVPLDALDPLLA